MITATDPTYARIITPQMQSGESLNHILRGELSAVEAYDQVLKTITEAPEKNRLKEFLDSHLRNVEYWTRQVEFKTISADTTSGPWGYVVKAFVGTAKLFGDSVTLMALKQGEEHGLSEYQTLLENPQVSESDKRFVRTTIIPELERHITSIDAMLRLQ